MTDIDGRWKPLATPTTAAVRAMILERTRQFFSSRNVMEIETPLRQRYTVTEPNIDSIAVTDDGETSYLQTSPEHQMKRLLAAGYPDIYQVCKVFRAGETGRRHMTEFSMVEWYRLGYSLHEMMQETVAYATCILEDSLALAPPVLTTYQDAFQHALGVDPLTTDMDELQEISSADHRLRASLGNDRDAWLDLLMATKVATKFKPDRFTVVYHYPATQAALARLNADEPVVAERFELFFGDVELANGFVELADADEQLARFEADCEKRRACGKAVPEIDPYLLAALRGGLPDCAGVALGLDRLLMLHAGAESLCDVCTFTLDKS